MSTVAAVDIGATSGRVMLATLDDQGVSLDEVLRFPNHPVHDGRHWVWDIDALCAAVSDGLDLAQAAGCISFGIDTWAVDFGVVRDGVLIGPVLAYRDTVHAGGVHLVHERISRERLYSIAGIQELPFNSVYQLAARPDRLGEGVLVMIPDLLGWRLTGALACDITNASSTGLIDPRTRTWSPDVIGALDLPLDSFLVPDEPGMIRGCSQSGLPLIGVATHDTASAFIGAPIRDRDRALVLSLGTWALIGAEINSAVPTEAARVINVSHELGIDGTVRVLANVCGTWLLEECRRDWSLADGEDIAMPELFSLAEIEPAFTGILDVDDPELIEPGRTAHDIARRVRGVTPRNRGALIRIICESMIARIAARAAQIERLLGTQRDVLHVVGGASRIDFIMQGLADATGSRVVAGPVEATALGNAAVQWRAHGDVSTIAEVRALIAEMPELRTFEPADMTKTWQDYAATLKESS